MKKLLVSAAAISSALSTARGQITYVDPSPDAGISPGQSLYFDFDNGTYSTSSSLTGWDARIRTYWASYYDYNVGSDIYRDESYAAGRNGWEFAQTMGYASRLSAGASLAFSDGVDWVFLETYNNGPWANDTGADTVFLGLKNDSSSMQAWIGVRYHDAADRFTLESFAIAPSSTGMTAGMVSAVPEPMETAAVMALLAGGAAAYHRRRQEDTQPQG